MTNAYSPAMALLQWGTPGGFPMPLRFALVAYAVAVAIAIAIAAAVAVAVAAAVAVAVVITTRRRRVGVGARASCSGPARRGCPRAPASPRRRRCGCRAETTRPSPSTGVSRSPPHGLAGTVGGGRPR